MACFASLLSVNAGPPTVKLASAKSGCVYVPLHTHARCGAWVVVCAYTQPPCLPTNQPGLRPCQLDPESTQTVMERWFSRGNGVELVSPSFLALRVRPGSVRGGEFEEEEESGFSTNRTFGGECFLFFASCTHGAKRAERDVAKSLGFDVGGGVAGLVHRPANAPRFHRLESRLGFKCQVNAYLRVDGVDRPGESLERAWNGPLSASRQVVELSTWCKMRLPGGVELSCILALRWTGRNRRRRGETRTLAS